MSTHRTRRRLAKAIAAPQVRSAARKTREAKVVSVGTGVATVEINADTENPIAGVPIAPGLTLTAGQVVELTFTGRAPLITRRIT